jgi:tetratricopeptide (TPR) repeat protein
MKLSALLIGSSLLTVHAQPPPGRCSQGVPALKKTLAQTVDPSAKKSVGLDIVRCAMESGEVDVAIAAMQTLLRENPGDAEVLYRAVHFYSNLSVHASRQLMVRTPGSAQAHQLNAEALEGQGKWEDAAREYRGILEREPGFPGIHFRLGRLILSQPPAPTTEAEARREFEAELKINPSNVEAEYVLGELDRQGELWPSAVDHFSKAAKLDPAFVEAQFGLGRALLSLNKPAEAIAPLEAAVRLQGTNPANHFLLGAAYRRSGRKADADREMQAYELASKKLHQVTDSVHQGLQPTGK